MVFDWFKRSAAPSPPATPPAVEAPEPAPAQDIAEPAAPEGLEPALPPEPEPEPAPAAEPAAPGVVDGDALAWARQAYARLKAQQEAAAAATAVEPAPVEPPLPEPLPAQPAGPPLTTGPEPPALVIAEPEPVAPLSLGQESVAPLPGALEPAGPVPPVVEPVAAEPLVIKPVTAAPEGAPPPAAAAGPSLLEVAAAQREQRRQELLAAAGVLAETPAPPALAPSAAAAVSSVASAVPAPAAAAPGSVAPPAAAAARADQAEPSLGAFDADFTWSAEVLAAQGRRLEEVSLEEIDWLTRLRRGLEKTRKGFVAQLLERLGDDPLSAESLEDLESTLLRADVGVQATDRVLEALRQRLNQEVVDPAEGLRFLKEQLRAILEEPITASGLGLLAPEKGQLNVWLLVGVNGVGKTTTLGKLANLAVRSGYSCLIAAADTFRAAAVQQVRVWGERSGVAVVSNPSANADPAAVVYDAIGAAKAKGIELVLVDTAGRLQTKHNLMEELGKVRRIVDKLAPEAVVQSLLVLDASQGQNGLRQAMAFASAAGLTGVVLTKLDGSARGGVALAVASEAKLPIRFVGAGETIRDLRPFNSFEFVEALLGG